MRATAVRLLRIEPLARREIAKRQTKLRLPGSLPAPGPASRKNDKAATAAVLTKPPAQSKKRPVASSLEAIAGGDPEYARALGSSGQKPDNLRLEPRERGKGMFFQVPKSKRYELVEVLREK